MCSSASRRAAAAWRPKTSGRPCSCFAILCSALVSAALGVETVDWQFTNDEAPARQFLGISRPVLVRGAPVHQWGAAKWTPSLLASRAGGVRVPVKNSSDPIFRLGCCTLSRVPLSQLVTEALDPNPKHYAYFSGPLAFLGRWTARDVNPSVFDMSDPRTRGTHRSQELLTHVWIGSRGVVTPTHYDEMHNFFFQAHGEKRFFIYPPSAWEGLRLYPKFHQQHRNARAGPLDAASARALALELNGVEVRVKAGDLLYIPPLWFHCVETMSMGSVSLNVWSASGRVKALGAAWDAPLPFDIGRMQVGDAVGATAVFVREMFKISAPSDPSRTARAWAEARYGGLGSMGEDITANVPPDVHVDTNSEESKRHRDYINRVESEAPSLLSQAQLTILDFATYCSLQERGFSARPGQVRAVREGTRRVMGDMFGLPLDGFGQIYAFNYIEDIVSQIVGYDHVEAMIKYCAFPSV